MKKNAIFVYFLPLILASLVSLPSLFASSKKAVEKIFSGRVIYVADDYFELKSGKTEISVYITEGSKFVSKDGKEGGKNTIEVCQYVKAYYAEEAVKKILTKIIVNKESDCVK